MNTVNAVFLLGVVSLLTFTAVMLVKAITMNYQRAGEIRRALTYRIQSLPMYRRLEKQEIPLSFYLHYQPTWEIESQVRACESCNSKPECEQQLRHKQYANEICVNEANFKLIKSALV